MKKKFLKKELELFLKHISDNCTDEYGHLQVVDTDDEKIKNDYHSMTIEGIVDDYLENLGK